MKTANSRLMATLTSIISILGITIIIGTLIFTFNNNTSQTLIPVTVSVIAPTASIQAYPISSETPIATQLSPKATIEAWMRATQTAAALTPWWNATIYPSPTSGPTATPDFSNIPHRSAGAGIIISDSSNFQGAWSIAVINEWFGLSQGIRVLAGVTSDPSQGAIAILAPGVDILSPEVYLTPQKVGPVQIVDAHGERLVLQALNSSVQFFFDVPTRQFTSSFEATVIAPTVTPYPTHTPIPPLPLVPSPTFGVPSTAYPVVTITPQPTLTAQATASP
jgi:hypothetical protein